MSIRTILKNGVFKFDTSGTTGLATNQLQLKTGAGIVFSDGTTLTTASGDIGPTGPAGPQGEKGDMGNTGQTGPQGEKGDKGDTGATGAKGDKGDTGNVGPTGATGSFSSALTSNIQGTQYQINFDYDGLYSSLDRNLLRLQGGGKETILNANDLLFNGLSVQTQLLNLSAYQQSQTFVYSSPAVYADGAPPATIPDTLWNTYAYQGWYFINSSTGLKINWYMPPAVNMTVGDLKALYFNIFNASTTSNDNTPFLTVYTKPTGSGDYRPWYHSKRTYVFNQSFTPVANTQYTGFLNNAGLANPPVYGSTVIPLVVSTVAPFPTGPYSDNEQILFFSFGSNSASPVNSVEFILSSVNIVRSSGTQSFQFMMT